jgi:hypothetical protein
MAYSDFNLTMLERRFGLIQKKRDFFPKPHRSIPPSEFLKADLEYAESVPTFSEKSKSEHLIVPIFKELLRNNRGKITYFSGYTFDVDPSQNLNGVCDFVFSRNVESVEIKSPIFCLVEAKNRTVEEGLGQCAAEMYAARRFNQESGEPVDTIYGCVTTGFEWVFLRLEGIEIQIDLDRFYLNELAQLLGALQTVIDFYT